MTSRAGQAKDAGAPRRQSAWSLFWSDLLWSALTWKAAAWFVGLSLAPWIVLELDWLFAP